MVACNCSLCLGRTKAEQRMQELDKLQPIRWRRILFFVFLVVAVVSIVVTGLIMLSGCALHNGAGQVVVTPVQEFYICRAGCDFISNPRQQRMCLTKCADIYTIATGELPPPTPEPEPLPTIEAQNDLTPVPEPRTTPESEAPTTATAAARPVATPVPDPSTYFVPKVDSNCTSADPGPDNLKPATPSYVKEVRQAIAMYRAAHPEQFEGSHLLLGSWANAYYFGVVDNLRQIGLEAVVDDCGGAGICGEIAVAAHGTKQGSGSNDQYHILTSGGDIRDPGNGGFRAKCAPKWF